MVLRGSQLTFYKDQKVAKERPDQTFRGEAPLNLHRAEASVATDYKKKKHVFRLKYVCLFSSNLIFFNIFIC